MALDDGDPYPDTLQRAELPQYGTPEFYVAKLEGELRALQAGLHDFASLVQRLGTIWADREAKSVVEGLERLAQQTARPSNQSGESLPPVLSLDRAQQLANALSVLVSTADGLPARDRHRVDCAVARLSRLLPGPLALPLLESWLSDRRRFRRRVAIGAIARHGLPPHLTNAVLALYRETHDLRLLRTMCRHPQVCALLEEADVRPVLDIPYHDYEFSGFRTIDRVARYWHMKALQALLVGGHVPSDSIALEFPMEFAWAVGRQSSARALPLLRRVLAEHRTDAEFVWRRMRAIGDIGSAGDQEQILALAYAIVRGASSTGAPTAPA